MRTKADIIESMNDECPWMIPQGANNYIKEAMEIYAKEYHQNKVKENELLHSVSKPFFCEDEERLGKCEKQCIDCKGFEDGDTDKIISEMDIITKNSSNSKLDGFNHAC